MEAVAVAADAQDRVLVFNRGEHPVMVFDRDGRFLRSWGEGLFARPHGIFIGPDDTVYCTDDLDHTVRKFTPDGRLLLTLGTSGKPSDTGATSVDYRTIVRVGPPFHYPTNFALSPEGEMPSAMATATLECISSLRMADYSSRGANREWLPANFSPMASRGSARDGTWPTGRTAASNSSHPTARSFPSGPMSRAHVRSSSTTREMCCGRDWVFARACGRAHHRTHRRRTGWRE